MFLFGFSVSPRIRALIGAVVLALGLVLHSVLLDVAGGALLLIAVGMWVYRSRREVQ
jgi:small-conductance mechanosensitive channel